ncbi:MAG: preprotein translocase subunit SecA [Bacteroidales bacterium]|nr:preprotein translocase subunit SecA [Candidatus Liminaster caballi]
MNINSILTKLFGNKSQRDVKAIQPWVEKIKAAYPAIEKLSNDELRARSQALMQQMQDAVAADRKKIEELRATIETLEVDKREKLWAEVDELKKKVLETFDAQLIEILPEVFAIVKHTAYRFANNETVEVTATQMDRDLAATRDFVTIEGDKAIYKTTWMAGGNPVRWDMVHYDVQLFGGVVLHQGKIAEMATGEGKTLVATLPVFLNAMTHNGVHVVTVNDYLAKRDCEWMGPLYQFHGLSVDCIDRYEPNSDARRSAYNCDITFGTNNEFGFDYLRDNMATHPEDLVQREHNFAIVDEVDSVLIDDARTPLIISGPTPRTSEYSDEELYQEFRPRVEKLVAAQKKLANDLLNEAKKKVLNDDKQVRDEGAVQLYRAYRAWPKSNALIKFLSEQGVKQEMLRAEATFLENNQQRMTEALEPLYFAIEEKNKQVDLTDKGIEMLTGEGEDPKFFVLPDVGSEVAEVEHSSLTAEEKMKKKDEIMDQFTTKGERVHAVNQLLKAYTMFEKDVDYIVSEDGKVKIVDEQTGRIMEGRRWSDGLHQAVEAKEHVKVEATTQTFATITLQNYFRMYHKLSGMTGTAETEAGEFWDIYKLDVVSIPTNRPIARKDLDDRVYRSKRAKYKAVIAQAKEYVAQGRPVLIGTTSVEISELLDKAFRQNGIIPNVLNAKLHQREAEIVAKAGMASTVTIATNMAGRGTDIKLSPEIKAAGGLAIIGTERHESRRVDRQLRGRSGRQGDPGSSVFFVSLEDNLMRIFGGDRISKIVDSKFFGGMSEDDVLESSMLSSGIEKAQKKVEENNFGIRKRLLEYDDVLNKQREVIYSRRRHALMGERIMVDFMNMAYDVAADLVKNYQETSDLDSLNLEVYRNLGVNMELKESDVKGMSSDKLTDTIFSAAMKNFDEKGKKLEETIGPRLIEIYERVKDGGIVKNVIVPFTDGKRIYQIPVNLEEANQTQGHNIVKTFLKVIMLHVIDEAWKENLRDLDDLKQSVQNAHYEQKDPLLIYKVESFGIFERMVGKMNSKATRILMRSQLHIPEPPKDQPEQSAPQQDFKAAAPQRRADFSRMQASHAQMGSALADRRPAGAPGAPAQPGVPPTPQPRRPIIAQPHVGRNDPCPCGSGLKYKNCHGKGL